MPRYIAVVDEFPKTPTEKIRKHELKARPNDEQTWERPAAPRRAPVG